MTSKQLYVVSDEYKQFSSEKSLCRKCSIYDFYKTVVQSEGNARNPTFLFCGESPGQEEVEQGRPFIGKAGQRLREELRKYPEVFNKKTTLITNVIPCRPLNNKFPFKDPMVTLCTTEWLFKEIKLLAPKRIVTLGAVPLFYLTDKTGINLNRGKWQYSPKFETWLFHTYHPSYVIRCQNDKNKQDVVKDFSKDIELISKSYKELD